jgi:alanyl-tRNA synthetase
MREAFPQPKTQADHVALVIKSEEESFGQTLDRGMELFDRVVKKVKSQGGEMIPGDEVFKLYDTYGFPVDLTQVMASEHGLQVDMQGFERELSRQRERSKNAADFGPAVKWSSEEQVETAFVGYDDRFSSEASVVAAQEADGKLQIVLDRTPFYGESGGQIGDTGIIAGDSFKLEVVDAKKVGDAVVHLVDQPTPSASEIIGANVRVQVDGQRQKATQRNHTATHLLHKALREVLGDHVQQSGSLVAPDRLRFDFSHFRQVTPEELEEIERRVNEQILANRRVTWKVTDLETARNEGAMMLFGEKYGEEVRLVAVEGYSKELCGGTHVQATGEIGPFVIATESAIAAGMRRIEALTGEGALRFLNEKRLQFDQTIALLKVAPEQMLDRVEELLNESKRLRKELDKAKAKSAVSSVSEMFGQAQSIDGVKILIDKFSSRDQLNAYADYTQTLKEPVLGLFYNDKNQYAVTSSKPAIDKGLSARVVINHLNKQLDGRGGGREYFTQGGTSTTLNDEILLSKVTELIRETG